VRSFEVQTSRDANGLTYLARPGTAKAFGNYAGD